LDHLVEAAEGEGDDDEEKDVWMEEPL